MDKLKPLLMTSQMDELCRRYSNRNVMTELAWIANYTKKGYLNKADAEFIAWAAFTAYNTILELRRAGEAE